MRKAGILLKGVWGCRPLEIAPCCPTRPHGEPRTSSVRTAARLTASARTPATTDLRGKRPLDGHPATMARLERQSQSDIRRSISRPVRAKMMAPH
jgi:hypothetical protein